MNYKQLSKKQKIKKKEYLIADNLVEGKHFKEIIATVNKKLESTKLSNRDKYLYGYALLQTQQNLKALITLWPLVAKGYTKLHEDCAKIAAHVFTDESSLLWSQLTEDETYTLLLAGKNLIPQSFVNDLLFKHLLEQLWQQEQFEKIEKIIKSLKEEFSGILIENLSKLDFFQPSKKLFGNIPAFIGHVLTGGACLIAREPLYHDHIDAAIHALANEIKLLFNKLKNNNQSVLWGKELFENFVDYEANVLIQVLQKIIKNKDLQFNIIPSPSYFICYDTNNNRVDGKFLPWLEKNSPELFYAYNFETYYAVLLILGGEKFLNNNYILTLANKDRFDPYLRLAAMLRFINSKKLYLEKFVELKDFANYKQTTNIFKDLVIQAVKIIISSQTHIKQSLSFWEKLFNFYPILQGSYYSNFLIAQVIEKLEKEYENCLNLDITMLTNIAGQINSDNFSKLVESWCIRQQTCVNFLLAIEDTSKSKKIIKKIQDEPSLREHLSIITDCCFFLYEDLSTQFFKHIEFICENKRVNKIISLKDLFKFDLNCVSEQCLLKYYRSSIQKVANTLNLSIAKLSDLHNHLAIQDSLKNQTSKLSILTQTDPFKILGVSLVDSKQVIMQKVMQLIQQSSTAQMIIYRQAQSELFNPVQRFLHQYLRYLSYKDHENSAVRANIYPNKPLLNEIPLRYEYLDGSK